MQACTRVDDTYPAQMMIFTGWEFDGYLGRVDLARPRLRVFVCTIRVSEARETETSAVAKRA